ncbi:MAG: NUDIX domain-containing protein [Streptomycetaceae bacterium]|nr:NUDIX domain-containing protein [Streptomycetaceae bacterium]
MAITDGHIRETAEDYLDAHPEDKVDLVPLLTLLDEGAKLDSRKEFRGHVTAGAVLTDGRGQVLMIHHRALSQWLLPGGHTEPEDTTLQQTALRELTEETGMSADDVEAACPRPLHVDIHTIPANAVKQEPEHRHIDFRFLFRTSGDVGELQAEEVTDAEWRDIAFILDPVLRRRISDALR